MVHSMTAFSRFQHSADFGTITLEIQSVNRKHLEVQTSMAKELNIFDVEIKKCISKKLNRGKVFVNLSYSLNESSKLFNLKPNLTLAKELQKCWSELSQELKIDCNESLSRVLVKEPQIFQTEVNIEFEKSFKKELLTALNLALDDLITARKEEGQFLKEKLLDHINQVDGVLNEIKPSLKDLQHKHFEKTLERLNKLLNQNMGEDERLHKEVAFLADKSDVTEEVNRLDSHIKQFKALIEKPIAMGKTLEFITQECMRELNTLGAKCSDIEVTQKVILAKSECEKIKEQIQNIE